MEFRYNRVIHSITQISPFEVVCDFNPLTLLDLFPLLNNDSMTNRSCLVKATFFRNLYKDVKAQIEKQMEKLDSNANSERNKILFQHGD